MSQLAQILHDDYSKLRQAVKKLFAHADDVNGQQSKQRIRNEGSGGAGQKNEQNTLKLEELKNEVARHLDVVHGALLRHDEEYEIIEDEGGHSLDPYIEPPKVRMRCKLLVTKVESFKDEKTGKTTSEHYSFCGVGGDAVQHGYPEDGRDEDNDFSRWSPSATFTLGCQNPALFGTIIEGERYYVDFTLANGVPVATRVEDKPTTDSGSLTTAEPEQPKTQVEPRTGQVIPENADPTVSDPKHGLADGAPGNPANDQNPKQ